MTGNYYQSRALGIVANEQYDITNVALGLSCTAGQFADMLTRYKIGHEDFRRDDMLSILEQALWYIAVGASVLGEDLDDTMHRGMENAKIRKRLSDAMRRGAENDKISE